MGATHFLAKGLDRVRTEMNLYVHLKRVMNLLKNEALMTAMKAGEILLAAHQR